MSKSQCSHHAGQLDDALQLDLAPPAADLRRAQRADQRAGLHAQVRRRPVQCGDLFAKARVGADPVPLDLLQALLDPQQGVGCRRQQCRDLDAGAGRRLPRVRAADQHADRQSDDEQQCPDEQCGGIHGQSMTRDTDSRARRADSVRLAPASSVRSPPDRLA